MMAGEPGTSTKRADLEWRGVGWLLVLLHDMPDLLDREAEEGLRETVATFGLVAPDGSLTERGEEARRAALRLLAERQVSPARIEAIAGGDVARWAALADAATPGPWEPSEGGDIYPPALVHLDLERSHLEPYIASTWGRGAQMDANADFIAAARTAVPALCADNARLLAEIASLRAALANTLTAAERALCEVAKIGPDVHRRLQADVPPTNAKERETSGYAAALVTASAWTCITGRPEDAARAFAGLLGAAGESEDGRRGAARALREIALLLEGRVLPTISAEQEIDALRAEAGHAEEAAKGKGERHGYTAEWWGGRARGMQRVLGCLATYLPVPPERP